MTREYLSPSAGTAEAKDAVVATEAWEEAIQQTQEQMQGVAGVMR